VVKPSVVQEQTLFEEVKPIMQPKQVKEKHVKPPKLPKPPKPSKDKTGGIKTFLGSITEFLNNDN